MWLASWRGLNNLSNNRMTATNHALTGAIIGLTIASPAALPIAFLSHYILDALPHFGWPGDDSGKLKTNLFRNYLFAEAFICFLIVLLLFVAQPTNWFLAAWCAFLAALPDWFSYGRYKKTRLGKPYAPNAYERFAHKIQWFEKPIGGVVEIVWAIAAIFILANIL